MARKPPTYKLPEVIKTRRQATKAIQSFVTLMTKEVPRPLPPMFEGMSQEQIIQKLQQIQQEAPDQLQEILALLEPEFLWKTPKELGIKDEEIYYAQIRLLEAAARSGESIERLPEWPEVGMNEYDE